MLIGMFARRSSGGSTPSGRLTIDLADVPPDYAPILAHSVNPWVAGSNFDDGGSDAFDSFGFFKIAANGATSGNINANGNGAVGDIASQVVTVGGASFTVESGWIGRAFFTVKVTGDGSTAFSLQASGGLGSDGATTGRKVFRTATVAGEGVEVKYVVTNDGPTAGADNTSSDPRIVYTFIPANPALYAVGGADAAWSFTPSVNTTDTSISDSVSMASASDPNGVVFVLSWGRETLETVATYIESALKIA